MMNFGVVVGKCESRHQPAVLDVVTDPQALPLPAWRRSR
jgi:hypothetical protein